jgi:hypothetical protein
VGDHDSTVLTSSEIALPLEEESLSQPTPSLESALEQLDARLEGATRALAQAQKSLKRATEAARLGQLREISRTLEALVGSARAVSQAAVNSQLSWRFPAEEYVREGSYLRELLALARQDGLPNVREVDGEIFSFPIIVKIDAGDLSLRLGKRKVRHLRPSQLVRALKDARTQPARDNLQRTLNAFEKAYLVATGGKHGMAVPLKQVYDLLVLRPGQSSEYTELDFMVDVYKLDRAAPQVTKSGREMSLPASTAARGGRGTRFVTESGEERLYASIRFDPVETP